MVVCFGLKLIKQTEVKSCKFGSCFQRLGLKPWDQRVTRKRGAWKSKELKIEVKVS